jgi:predicted permease
MSSIALAVNIVLSILMMIGLGMFLTHIKWLSDENAQLLSNLVIKVALPGMIINNMLTKFTRAGVIEQLPGLLAALASITISLGIGHIAARAAKVPANRRGALVCMFSFSNSIYIGVPVSLALFGPEALPYALMYYIANTTFFWTAGVGMLRRDSGSVPLPGRMSALIRSLPLPLFVFFICMALVLMGVNLSESSFIASAASYIGGMATPRALLFTGILIVRMLRSKHARWERGYELMLIGRFLVSPLLAWGLSALLPISTLARNVIVMQAAMPVMAQTSIVAESVGADSEYAAGGLALSTFAALIMIPLYMFLMTATP